MSADPARSRRVSAPNHSAHSAQVGDLSLHVCPAYSSLNFISQLCKRLRRLFFCIAVMQLYLLKFILSEDFLMFPYTCGKIPPPDESFFHSFVVI